MYDQASIVSQMQTTALLKCRIASMAHAELRLPAVMERLTLQARGSDIKAMPRTRKLINLRLDEGTYIALPDLPQCVDEGKLCALIIRTQLELLGIGVDTYDTVVGVKLVDRGAPPIKRRLYWCYALESEAEVI